MGQCQGLQQTPSITVSLSFISASLLVSSSLSLLLDFPMQPCDVAWHFTSHTYELERDYNTALCQGPSIKSQERVRLGHMYNHVTGHGTLSSPWLKVLIPQETVYRDLQFLQTPGEWGCNFQQNRRCFFGWVVRKTNRGNCPNCHLAIVITLPQSKASEGLLAPCCTQYCGFTRHCPLDDLYSPQNLPCETGGAATITPISQM